MTLITIDRKRIGCQFLRRIYKVYRIRRYNPRLAIGDGEDVYAVWESPSENANEIFFAKFVNGSWVKPISISSISGISEDPTITVDERGHIHVVWQGIRGETYQIFYREWDGSVWKEPKVVSESEKLLLKWNHHPAIAAEHETVHIFWQSGSSKPEIYYVKLSENFMSNPANLSKNGGSSLWPRVSVDSQRNIHVVWRDDTSGNSEILLRGKRSSLVQPHRHLWRRRNRGPTQYSGRHAR